MQSKGKGLAPIESKPVVQSTKQTAKIEDEEKSISEDMGDFEDDFWIRNRGKFIFYGKTYTNNLNLDKFKILLFCVK